MIKPEEEAILKAMFLGVKELETRAMKPEEEARYKAFLLIEEFVEKQSNLSGVVYAVLEKAMNRNRLPKRLVDAGRKAMDGNEKVAKEIVFNYFCTPYPDYPLAIYDYYFD